ncbi:hypothetical protein AAZX31_08G288300 [Glycine max]
MNGAPHVLSELNWIEWKIGWSNQMSQSEPLVDKVNSKAKAEFFFYTAKDHTPWQTNQYQRESAWVTYTF